jgi:hypothetical protein
MIVVWSMASTIHSFKNESDLRGGEIVDSIDDAPEALRRVAEYLDFNHRLADDCIANLPADEI